LLTSKGAKIVVFKKTKEGYRPLKASEVDFEQIDDKDYEILLIQKKDGTTLYATRDLAMIWYRAQKIGAKKIYYVVGKEQSLHFQLVFSLAEVL
jgi:arginyl-tRNA synthetase